MSVKVEFNTLYWEGSPTELIDSHKKVTKHFQLPVNYYTHTIQHGLWMDHICSNSNSDVIGFFDGDCVPLSRDAVLSAVNFVKENNTLLGIAQVSNHIPPKTHIYAAPAFFFITKDCWKRINTSFVETARSDVGEELTYKAESLGIRYKCLYPTYFEREPVEGVWRLSNYGLYGVGTVFGNVCYHLYQGRMSNNLELFVNRCREIVEGTFDPSTFHSATNFNYKGRIVP